MKEFNKTKRFIYILSALVLALSMSLVTVVPAMAVAPNEVWVDDDWAGLNPGDPADGHIFDTDAFAKIQDGIDAVAEGGTVSVATGTYSENVTVNKQLTLIGDVDQPSNVVVDAGDIGDHAITLTEDGCVLQGFKVQHGEHGIYLDNSDNNTLTSNIANSNAEHGIYLDKSNNNTLTSNMAKSNAEYGIYLDNSNNNTLTSNIANLNTKDGIYLDGKGGSHGNTLTRNTTNQNSEGGIHLDKNSNNNTLARNTIRDNTGDGINIDASNNNTLTGNHIIYNNRGVYMHGATDASTISINFNNIYGNTTYGVNNTLGTSDVDFENNWWGDASGPTHAENPPGTGNAVSGNVDYDPWLDGLLTDSKTEQTAAGNQTVDAKTEANTEVDKSGTGMPTITASKYDGNPAGGNLTFSAASKYVDVHTDNVTNVDEIVIKVYYTSAEIERPDESSLRLYWWDGTNWITCSDSGATYPAGEPTYRGYMWAKIRSDTTPNLTQLTGSVFGGGVPVGIAVTVFLPAISNLTITPTVSGIAEVKLEEAVTITAQVKNMGDGAGSYTVTLTINGVVEEKRTVTLAPWEKKTVTFTVVKDEAATYEVQVNNLKGEFIVSESPLPPASFEVTDLSISPAKVRAGETVTISVLVSETSGGSGTYNVTLKINGVIMGKQEVTLASQQSQTVTFTIAKQEAGSYKVEINGLAAEFIVEGLTPPAAPTSPPPPKVTNWYLFIGIIAAVVAIAITIFLTARRRA